jgi:hypothetical protein
LLAVLGGLGVETAPQISDRVVRLPAGLDQIGDVLAQITTPDVSTAANGN